QLPYIDGAYAEVEGWRLLSSRGIITQASVVDSRWRTPEAMFFLFRGGGGHPTHIFDFEFSFIAGDGAEHRIHTSESYPPVWNSSMVELQKTFRKGNVIPIRYSPMDFAFARTETYLHLFKPAVAANLFFLIAAPWIFAAPVLIRSIFIWSG